MTHQNHTPGQEHTSASSPVTIPSESEIDAALSQVDAADCHAAAALLTLPLDAAPGIDFGFTDDAVSYRGVVVRRAATPGDTARSLATALAESQILVSSARDLTADRRSWVGSYRSGTRVYTAGLWLLFGLPDLALPAELENLLDPLVDYVISHPHLAETLAERRTRLTVNNSLVSETALGEESRLEGGVSDAVQDATLVLTFPADPASGFAVVDAPSLEKDLSQPLPLRDIDLHFAAIDESDIGRDGSPLSPAWTAADEVVSQLMAWFTPAPEVTVVPLDSPEEGVSSAELVFEYAGFVCVLPVASDGYAATIGVELPRDPHPVLPPADLPSGFTLVGVDPFDDSLLASHDLGYVFSLFPVGETS